MSGGVQVPSAKLTVLYIPVTESKTEFKKCK